MQMNEKTWCDHCGNDVDESKDSISLIYVDMQPIWVCEECLDTHYPLYEAE